MAATAKISVTVDDLATAVLANISSAVGGVATATTSAMGDIGSKIKEAFESPKESISHFGEVAKEAFEHPLEGIQSMASALSGQLLGVLGELGVAGGIAAAGIGAVIAAAAADAGILFGLANHAAEAGDEVKDFGLKTGIAVENIGPLEFAVKAAGGSLNDLAGILQKVEMKAATDQGGKFASALADIGINADAFKKMDSEAQILALGEGFRRGADSGNLMADAVAIGGRGMASSIPLLEKMSGELLKTGESMGIAWSPEKVEQAEKFRLGMGTMETALGNIGTQIGAELLPAMSAMVETFAKSPAFMEGVTSVVDGLAHGLGIATIVIGEVAGAAITLLAPSFGVVTFAGTLVVDTVKTLWDWTWKIIDGFTSWASSSATLGSAFTMMRDVIGGVVDWIRTKLESLPFIGDSIKHGFDNAAAAFTATEHAGSALGGTATTLGAALLGVGGASEHAAGTQLSLNRAHSEGAEGAKKYADAWTKGLDDVNKIWDQAATIEAERGKTGLELQLVKLDGQRQAEIDGWQKRLDAGNVAQEVFDQAMFAIDDKYRGLSDDATVAANKKFEDNWQATQGKIDEIYQTAANTREELDLRGVALQLAKLQTQENNQKASWQRQLDSGKISREQFDAAIDAIDVEFSAKREQTQTTADAKLTSELATMWTDLYDDEASQGMTAADKQIASVKKWYDDKVIKARDAGITDQRYYDELYELADRKTKDVIKLNDPWYKANQKLREDEKRDWDTLLGDVYDGFSKTFSKDIVAVLDGDGGFHQVWKDLWGKLKQDVAGILSDLLNNVIQGFISGAEQKLGGFLAGLASSGGSGGGGWLAALLAAFGHGGDGSSSTPITNGYFDPTTGVWSPIPGGGQYPAIPEDPRHEAEGGLIRARHMAGGGIAFPGRPEGVDQIPVWMAEGEGVLNTRAMRNVGEPMLNHLNRGGEILNTSAMERKQDEHTAMLARLDRSINNILLRMPRMFMAAQQLSGR